MIRKRLVFLVASSLADILTIKESESVDWMVDRIDLMSAVVLHWRASLSNSQFTRCQWKDWSSCSLHPVCVVRVTGVWHSAIFKPVLASNTLSKTVGRLLLGFLRISTGLHQQHHKTKLTPRRNTTLSRAIVTSLLSRQFFLGWNLRNWQPLFSRWVKVPIAVGLYVKLHWTMEDHHPLLVSHCLWFPEIAQRLIVRREREVLLKVFV